MWLCTQSATRNGSEGGGPSTFVRAAKGARTGPVVGQGRLQRARILTELVNAEWGIQMIYDRVFSAIIFLNVPSLHL